MRGNHTVMTPETWLEGPIPAYAGQPDRHYIAGMKAGAYPRVCGATSLGQIWARWPEGLSPRMRGNLLRHQHRQPEGGPIPAYAGQP